MEFNREYRAVLRRGKFVIRDHFVYKQRIDSLLLWPLSFVIISITFLFLISSCCHAKELTASWYSEESCRREGTSGIMANGRRLDDKAFTVASWDYPFGTKLRVKNLQNGKSVRVVVTDRGPSKRLYRNGRVLDLSRGAFQAIAHLDKGIIPISFEVIE